MTKRLSTRLIRQAVADRHGIDLDMVELYRDQGTWYWDMSDKLTMNDARDKEAAKEFVAIARLLAKDHSNLNLFVDWMMKQMVCKIQSKGFEEEGLSINHKYSMKQIVEFTQNEYEAGNLDGFFSDFQRWL